VRSKQISAILGLFSGAVVWGLIWYPYRILEDAGIRGDLAVLVSYSIALIFGLILFYRNLSELRKASWMLLWIALGTGYANLAYVLSVIEGEVVRVLLLFYLSPLWTILCARVLLGEKLNKFGWTIIFFSLAGAVTMLWNPKGGLPLPQNVAEWLALSAGMAFAFSNVLIKKAEHMSIELKSFAVWAGILVLTIVPILLKKTDFTLLLMLPAMAWVILILLGVVLVAVNLAVQHGLMNTYANQAIVILLLELVVGAISSYFLAGETIGLKEWIGGAMIVSASLFSAKMTKIE
jgi:drug/metabolite transporter (DMT)-like permease